jgi:RNA polymerase sigma-70 factor, ECF subfamily
MSHKRTNEEWLADLHSSGENQESALEDLRAIILAGLPYALQNWLSPDDPRLDALAEEVTQESLLRVLAHLDEFENRSQFTTWVHKIAVRVALSELRRRRWKETSLDSVLDDEENPPPVGLLEDKAPALQTNAEKADLLERVKHIITDELTPRQSQALIDLSIRGMPMDEVAKQMGSERNALYKLLHDARLRLKKRLAREGISPNDILELYDQ